MHNTNWTFDHVEALATTRIFALLTHWKEYPPVAELTAARMGIKPKEKGTIDDIMKMFPGGSG